jgi:hypothetical protein
MAAAGIAPEDDDGNEASKQMPAKKAPPAPIDTVRPDLLEQANNAASQGLDAYAMFYKSMINAKERTVLAEFHEGLKAEAQKADSAKNAPTETQGE